MAGKRPVFTENFSANLTDIEAFLGSEGRAAFSAFKRLLDRLFGETIPTLCRFPESGRSLLDRTVKSSKAAALRKDLQSLFKKGDHLREFIMDDHMVLYLIRHERIAFLAIKHHRQLSFDLKHFWLQE